MKIKSKKYTKIGNRMQAKTQINNIISRIIEQKIRKAKYFVIEEINYVK